MPRYILGVVLACLLAAELHAQTSTATLQGFVRDPSGAGIPEAKVNIRNIRTGVVRELRTSAEGRYVEPFLLPGDYEITVEKTGFRRFTQSGIKLDVQQNLSLNVELVLGEVSTAVEVTGTPPPLATNSATISTTVENKRVVDLPLNGRNLLALSTLVPGVYAAGGSTAAQIDMWSPNVGGGRTATSSVMVDGAPLSVPDPTSGKSSFGGQPPSVDAVEEFTVQVNNLAAEYGRTGGGVINVATKQGTNQLHGTLREFLRNSKMDANNFFSNRAGVPLASFQRNQFGFSLGGPIFLPKIYNGRNRTFFFVDYERQATRTPAVMNTTMPLDKWKQGDFSGLMNSAGKPILIFDPLTTRPNGASSYTRDAFPGNIIPQNRIDPVARNVATYYPSPNMKSVNPFTEVQNFFKTSKNIDNSNILTVRVDHDFTSAWRTYVRANWATRYQNAVDFYGNGTTAASDFNTPRYAAVWDNTYTLNPTTVVNLRYGFSRFDRLRLPVSIGFDPTTLGFPSYLASEAAKNMLQFPAFGMTGFAGLGGSGIVHWTPNSHNLAVSATKVLSRHTLKAGFEYLKYLLNMFQTNGPDGSFSFGPVWTQRDPVRASTTEGFSVASFLLGLGSGTQSNAMAMALASSYFGFYLQDDFRVTSRLTLNLGVRYELDVPRTERYNRLSYFDATAPSPIVGKVPGFPNLTGAMKFAGPGDRRQTPMDNNNIGPRFGFSYQINSKTVARGGYALMYDASPMQAAYHNAGFEGFRTSTSMITSLDGRLPYRYLRDPFPDGFQQVLGPTPGPTSGPSTDLGLSITDSWISEYVNPVIQQWNFNLQRELRGGVVLQAGYLGSKGNHLQDGENNTYNQLLPTYLSLGNSLNDQVPNPFYGVITDPNSILSQPTVARRQLLRPNPQYVNMNPQWRDIGNSLWHAFTLQAEKRFSRGLGFLVSFTGGKLIGDCEGSAFYTDGGNTARQNVYDRRAERAISSQDVARRLVISGTYELPVGHGRRFLSGSHALVDS
ncbi:MAG: carboxypeptidase regulatory-like domain-containing protein, partial [Acidobacteria bacterium]|nr:carboxypeptidase regulatory-like domain-containing protein [Acidobacteriota bacterium]